MYAPGLGSSSSQCAISCAMFSRRRDSASERAVLVPLRVMSELVKQPKQVGGDALAGGGRGRLQDLEHGIHSHAFRCGEREAPALRVIGAGLKQTPECLRSQARHQSGDALAGPRFQGSGAPGDLLGHLPEVVQDHPVVARPARPDRRWPARRGADRLPPASSGRPPTARDSRAPPSSSADPRGASLRLLVPSSFRSSLAELGCLKLDVLPRRRALELQPQGPVSSPSSPLRLRSSPSISSRPAPRLKRMEAMRCQCRRRARSLSSALRASVATPPMMS